MNNLAITRMIVSELCITGWVHTERWENFENRMVAGVIIGTSIDSPFDWEIGDRAYYHWLSENYC